jgi:hypothetical protein
MEMLPMTKTTIALATALLLGVASAAYAGGRDDADYNGGHRVGPLGNTATSGVNPVDHPSLRNGYAAQNRVERSQSRQ